MDHEGVDVRCSPHHEGIRCEIITDRTIWESLSGLGAEEKIVDRVEIDGEKKDDFYRSDVDVEINDDSLIIE